MRPERQPAADHVSASREKQIEAMYRTGLLHPIEIAAACGLRIETIQRTLARLVRRPAPVFPASRHSSMSDGGAGGQADSVIKANTDMRRPGAVAQEARSGKLARNSRVAQKEIDLVFGS